MIKRLFNFKYPKLMLLGLAIILAYILFKNPSVQNFVSHLGALSYIGIFIAGMLFAFGFTAPFSVGFFISLTSSNIWLAGIVGGSGALVADLIIFSTIKFSFEEEFKRLRNSKAIVKFKKLMERSFAEKTIVYLMYAFAGILIASPLPDEAGVIMLAGLTKISARSLSLISFILNTIGILILLAL